MIYIPLVLIGGIALGWTLASRSSRAELSRLRAELAEHERRAARDRLARTGAKRPAKDGSSSD